MNRLILIGCPAAQSDSSACKVTLRGQGDIPAQDCVNPSTLFSKASW